jgi:hypothetical protein
MYLARFSYDVLPADRERAIEFIRAEIEAARRDGLEARLLVPLTRGSGGAALQFEVQLSSLEQLEHVRHRGGPGKDTATGCAALARFYNVPQRLRSCAWTRCRAEGGSPPIRPQQPSMRSNDLRIAPSSAQARTAEATAGRLGQAGSGSTAIPSGCFGRCRAASGAGSTLPPAGRR